MDTAYRLTITGRLHYMLWGVVAAVFVYVIMNAVLNRVAQGRPLTEPEWVFISAYFIVVGIPGVLSIWRAVSDAHRLIVSPTTITYRGFFKTVTLPLTSIVSARPVWDKAAGFRWVRVEVADPNRSYRATIKLDLSGLSPSRDHFLKQLSALVPDAEISFLSAP